MPQRERFAQRTRTVPAVVWLAVLGGVVGGAGAAAERPGDAKLPDSPTLHAVMSATIGAGQHAYAVAATAGGFAAAVRGGAAATIHDGALDVAMGEHRWTLAAARIGRRGRMAPFHSRTPARAAANRVELAGGGVTAWFVDGPAGLEQGWTLGKRPHGHGDLRLAMAVGGDLRPHISADGRSVELAAPGGAVLAYGGLAAYDATGHDLPARFSLGDGDLRIVVRDAGATYPVTVDPFVQVATLLASDATAQAFLGSALAMSSDGSTLAVGAPGVTVGSNVDQGAVYLFVRGAGGWASGTQTAKMIASDGMADDELAGSEASIAVSSDGSTVVAAAGSATVGGNDAQGAAYVFVKPESGWASGHETAKLTASDGAQNDDLGFVAVSGDGATVAAGAGNATVLGQASEGAVYVFARPAGGWVSGVQTAKLTASDGGKDDGLGGNVALSADGATLAAGASGATINLSRAAGAVYVFAKPASGWIDGTQVAKLTASNGAVDAGLGLTTALSGDGSTIAAGANGTTIAGHINQGAVYVFAKPGGGWASATQTAMLTESDGAMHDEFGTSAAVSGDGSTIVGGAPNADVGGHLSQGALYVYVRPAGGWSNGTETEKLTAAGGAAESGLFEAAVSADGSTIAGGAEDAPIGSLTQAGAVYVWSSGGCAAGATTLCIDDRPGDRRWQVTASYATAEGGGLSGKGEAIPLASLGVSEGGLFWFFDSTNPEMLIKVINGCAVNQEFWVFSSATTNVGFTVTVLDTKTGRSRVYSNKDGTPAPPIQDTSAIACIDGDAGPPAAAVAAAPGGALRRPAVSTAAVTETAPPAPAAPTPPEAGERAACTTTATTLCITGRFEVSVHFHTTEGGGSSGPGTAIGLDSLGVAQGGLFWFFDADNPEMLVKVLNACSLDNRFWIFYAAGTNVGFTLTVSDTQTGKELTFRNADGTAAPPVQDTDGLPCG